MAPAAVAEPAAVSAASMEQSNDNVNDDGHEPAAVVYDEQEQEQPSAMQEEQASPVMHSEPSTGMEKPVLESESECEQDVVEGSGSASSPRKAKEPKLEEPPNAMEGEEPELEDERVPVRQPSRSTSIGLPSRMSVVIQQEQEQVRAGMAMAMAGGKDVDRNTNMATGTSEQPALAPVTTPGVQYVSHAPPVTEKADAPTHPALSQQEQDALAKNRARGGRRAMGQAATVTPGVQFVANSNEPTAPSSSDADLLAKYRASGGDSSRNRAATTTTTTTTPGVVHVTEPEFISPGPPALSQAQQDREAKNRARGGVAARTMGAAVVPGAVSVSGSVVDNVEPQPSSPPSTAVSQQQQQQLQDRNAKNRARNTHGAAAMRPGVVHVSHSAEPSPSQTAILSHTEQDAMAKARVANMNGMPVQNNNTNNADANAKNRARGTQAPSVTPGVVHVSGPSEAVMNSSMAAPAGGTTQEELDVISKSRARRAANTRRQMPHVAPTPGVVHVSSEPPPSKSITNMTQQEQDEHAKQQARASRVVEMERETSVAQPLEDVDMVSPMGPQASKADNMTQAEQDTLAKNRGRRPVAAATNTNTVGATTHSAQSYQGGAPPVVTGVGPQASKADNMTQAEQDTLAKNRGRRPVAAATATNTVGATTHSAQAYQGGAPPVVPGVVSVSGEEAQEVDERVRRKEERAERRENRRTGAPATAEAATGGVIVGAHAYASSEPSVEHIKTQQGGVVHSAGASNSSQAPPTKNDNAANPLYTSSAAMSAEERQRRIDAKFAQVEREDEARADRMEQAHSDTLPASHSDSIMASKELYPEEPTNTIQVPGIVPIVLQPTLGNYTTADRGVAVAPDVEYGQIQQPLVENQDLAVAIAIADDEDDNKYFPAAVEYDPNAKPPIYKNRRFRVYMGVGCCILLVVIIMAIVGTTVLGDDGGVVRETNEPTLAPTMAPTTSEQGRYGDFFAKQISELVYISDSPHDLALQWILNEDPLNLDINSTRVLQRYMMVFFYYSTSNNGLSPWRSCNPAVDGEDDSCVFLEFTRDLDDSIFFAEKPGTRWLSGRDECDWEGVVCLGGDTILGIDIAGQNLVGSLPTELATMNFLQQISVPFNDMIGTIPEEYAGMKHLIALEVQNNRLTGTLPDVFFSAEGFDDVTSKLQVLNVGGNLLHGTVSSDLGNMRTLKGLHLFDNSFVGDFPLGLEKLGSLAFSRVNGNEFTGPLPSALGRLGLLTEVWFHDNRFTGPIPTEVGRLLRCTDFRIHNNLGITGNIPDEIFNMKRLKRLDLYQMDLTGPLSTRVGELVELEQLRVSTNRLTGRIPAEIQNLVRLQLFWSQLNLFVGSIPEVICNDVLKFLQADCGPIGSPAVSCRCCSACCDRDSQPQTCLLTESTSG